MSYVGLVEIPFPPPISDDQQTERPIGLCLVFKPLQLPYGGNEAKSKADDTQKKPSPEKASHHMADYGRGPATEEGKEDLCHPPLMSVYNMYIHKFWVYIQKM